MKSGISENSSVILTGMFHSGRYEGIGGGLDYSDVFGPGSSSYSMAIPGFSRAESFERGHLAEGGQTVYYVIPPNRNIIHKLPHKNRIWT
jgi:hypothetical protein